MKNANFVGESRHRICLAGPAGQYFPPLPGCGSHGTVHYDGLPADDARPADADFHRCFRRQDQDEPLGEVVNTDFRHLFPARHPPQAHDVSWLPSKTKKREHLLSLFLYTQTTSRCSLQRRRLLSPNLEEIAYPIQKHLGRHHDQQQSPSGARRP